MKNIFLFLFFLPIFSFSQYGILDETFGENGFVRTIELPDTINYLYPRSITTDEDGNVFVLSNFRVSKPDLGIWIYNIMLTKYDPDGVQDMNFGVNGFKPISINENETEGFQINMTKDNSLLILGAQNPIGNQNDRESFIYKIDTNAEPILDFGNQGISTIDCVGCQISELIVNEDNSIYLGGFSTVSESNDFSDILISKLNENGMQDFMFATNGFISISEELDNLELKDLEFDSETGDFYVLANLHGSITNYLYKTNHVGELQESLFISEGNNYFNAIYLAGNNLFVAGYDSVNMYMVGLKKSDLTFDENFAINGEFVFETENISGAVQKMFVKNDRILLAGSDLNDCILVSTFTNGDLDTDFGGEGYLVANINEFYSDAPISASIHGEDRLFILDAYYLGIACIKIYEGLEVEDILENSKILIAPNPTSNSFVISGLNGNQNLVQIFDLSGKLIQEFNSVQNNQILNLGSIPKGTYVVKINSKVSKKLSVK